jgi:hypothetical protein
MLSLAMLEKAAHAKPRVHAEWLCAMLALLPQPTTSSIARLWQGCDFCRQSHLRAQVGLGWSNFLVSLT